MIKIAILGLGTVGTGVVKVVEANTAPIRHRLGEPLGVKTALVRTLRKGPVLPPDDRPLPGHRNRQ